MKIANYYIKLEDNQVQCLLCPHDCIINSDKAGFCEVRKNFDGTLMAMNYGRVSTLHFAPIEKQPLFHFYPGSTILSVGGIGCNMLCTYCNTHHLSQGDLSKAVTESNTPYEIVSLAQSREDNLGISFSYNEPIMWFEFIMDVARISNDRGLKNILVTNGFINPGPLNELMQVYHAFCVDLKSFSDEFYRKVTSSRISPVKRSLQTIANSGKHLELTYTVIPGLNDQEDVFKIMIAWIAETLGPNTVLHIKRYFPAYRMTMPAPKDDKMMELYASAKEQLNYVYLGNIVSDKGADTLCHQCQSPLIVRKGFNVKWSSGIIDSKCYNCGEMVFNFI